MPVLLSFSFFFASSLLSSPRHVQSVPDDQIVSLNSTNEHTWWVTTSDIDPSQEDSVEPEQASTTWKPALIPENQHDRLGLPRAANVIWMKKVFIAPSTHQPLMLRIDWIQDRDVTYVNGHIVGRTGDWNSPEAQGYDRVRMYAIPEGVIKHGAPNVLLVRIKNNLLGEIGIMRGSVSIGPGEMQMRRYMYQNLITSLPNVAYFTAAIYFLFLFLHRRKDRAHLYFATFLLAIVFYFIVRSQMRFDLGVSFHLMKRLEYVTFFLLGPAFYMFISAYFNRLHMPERLRRYLGYASILFFSASVVLAVVVLTQPDVDTWNRWNWMLNIPAMTGFFVLSSTILVYLALRRNPDAVMMLTAVLLVLLSFVHDIAVQRGWLGYVFRVSEFTMFLLLMSMAGILANNYVRIHRQADDANAELAAKNDSLSRLDRLKDDFLANTSHELHTPLNGIMGLAEATLLNPEDKPMVVRHSQMIVSSGRRLTSLVNDILDFSKMRNSDLHLQLKPVHLKGIAEVVLLLSSPLANAKKLEIILSMADDLPLVEADENRLQQILINLVGNAIKFTQQGSVTLSAQATDDRVIVSVADTGIGIPESKQSIIFESFQQADGSISREFGGTGLGLAIVKNLVELHGSNIEVQSESGKGSTFSFSLRKANGEGQLAAVDVVSSHSGRLQSDLVGDPDMSTAMQETRKNTRTEKVLIVDDEPINLSVLESQLKSDGYLLESASDGFQAIAKLGEFLPDVILLDLMMPRMSGLEVCRRVREEHPSSSLPIIILSAKNQVSDLVEALEAGANDYLTKPFSRNELLARLRVHIGLRSSVLEQARLARSFERFVPSNFLQLLGKERITDIALGDSTLKHMSVLFSDIRSFTSLSEKMSPDDTFKFLNSYLKRMEPAIHRHGGFVDKYIGDAIMSLFRDNLPSDSSADNALSAALDMRREIHSYNQHRLKSGFVPIETGIGINTGSMMLGTLGSPNRLDTTVIGNTVNLASRLEALTAFYRCGILISDFTYKELRRLTGVLSREVGAVTVKGKNEPVGIYEVFETDPDEIKDLKQETSADLYMGIVNFKIRQFFEAEERFRRVLAVNPEDRVAETYLARCLEFAISPPAEQWNGEIEMKHK